MSLVEKLEFRVDRLERQVAEMKLIIERLVGTSETVAKVLEKVADNQDQFSKALKR